MSYGRRHQSLVRPAVYGLLLAAVASYLTVVWLAGPPARGVVASAGLALGQGVCGLALVLGHRRTPPGMRRVWLMCGASALLSAGIFGCWTYYAVRYDELPPVLSLADVFFVGSVVLLLLAALLWPGNTPRRRERRRYLADGAVLAGSLLLLSWTLVVGPHAGLSGDGSWQTAVALLYPALDVLAVAAGVYARWGLRCPVPGRRPGSCCARSSWWRWVMRGSRSRSAPARGTTT